jgi:hypothetical protein
MPTLGWKKESAPTCWLSERLEEDAAVPVMTKT